MDDLLQQGITAAKSGDGASARKFLIAATKQNPEDETGWGWLYRVSQTDAEKRYCLEQITRINPQNIKAVELLKALNEKENPLDAVIPNHHDKTVAAVPPAKKKNSTLNIILAIILSCVVIAVIANWSSGNIPTGEPSTDLRTQLDKALGTSNRNVARISNFCFDATSETISITIAGNDNLSESLINRGFMSSIVTTLKTIQQSKTTMPYTRVAIIVTFPTVDTLGNTKESMMVRALYLRSTLDKVNWDNFLTDDAYTIADPKTLYLHPGVNP